MHHNSCIPVFLVGLLCFYGFLSCVSSCSKEPETPDWRMTLKTIRNGIHNIDKYLNVALDLFGGQDGLCHYECSDGYKPEPRPGYKPHPPNGCGSPLFGFQFDIGIPSLTKCCNQHDRCYDTCNRDKHDCDDEFQECLETICGRLQKMLGLAQSVQGKMATGMCLLGHATENILQQNTTMSVSYCSFCLFQSVFFHLMPNEHHTDSCIDMLPVLNTEQDLTQAFLTVNSIMCPPSCSLVKSY
uniref:Phospholipase A2, group XIIA n=1 Tax=Hucho hucho TaxID=62062 RepID=A0A4W5Q3K6_9TELE